MHPRRPSPTLPGVIGKTSVIASVSSPIPALSPRVSILTDSPDEAKLMAHDRKLVDNIVRYIVAARAEILVSSQIEDRCRRPVRSRHGIECRLHKSIVQVKTCNAAAPGERHFQSNA